MMEPSPGPGASVADLQARLQAAVGDAYGIEKELGGGGMSRVFLATEASLHRQVVIKLLPPEFASEVSEARFKQEIELAAHLQHTNILPVHTAGAKDDLLFYVMPFVSGEAVRHRLTREGKLPIVDDVRILHEIADALGYAHAEGVIHRDVKPENILLLGTHAVLMDFGVARALTASRSGGRLTETGISVGTPAYMSPEQAAGERHIDASADVYALAVVGYEMLAGMPPFRGPTAQAVIAAHMTATPRPLSDVRPETPPEIEEAIMQALAKDPNTRLRTAAEFRDAIATPAAAARRRWAVVRKPVLVAVGAAVLAVAAGTLILLRGNHAAGASARSVAVLPFENIGGSESGQSFSDGIQDDILTQLTKIAALSVTSRASVQEYRRTAKNVRQIGRELGVRALLEGQVQRAANRVHVNVQLIDAENDRQLWAESYDRELTAQDVFAIQDSIAHNVAEALRIRLTPAEARAIAETPTTNLEALDYFHRGRELFDRRGGTAPDTEAPLAFERAVSLDPGFAPAWAGLAAARSWLIRQYLAFDTSAARQALDRAATLAPGAPETELARGLYEYYAKGA